MFSLNNYDIDPVWYSMNVNLNSRQGNYFIDYANATRCQRMHDGWW